MWNARSGRGSVCYLDGGEHRYSGCQLTCGGLGRAVTEYPFQVTLAEGERIPETKREAEQKVGCTSKVVCNICVDNTCVYCVYGTCVCGVYGTCVYGVYGTCVYDTRVYGVYGTCVYDTRACDISVYRTCIYDTCVYDTLYL